MTTWESPINVLSTNPDRHVTRRTLDTNIVVANTNSGGCDGWQHEGRLVTQLALPTMVIKLGTYVPGFLLASVIGRRYGVAHLAGFSLAIMTSNFSTISFIEGLYSASDTLSPQVYGAGQNYPELGRLAIRGFAVSMIVALPMIVILCFCMQSILEWLGQDVEAAGYAEQWYRIYIGFLPFYALYQVASKFLAAQHVMLPLVISAVLSSCVVLPSTLQLCSAWLGYTGTAVAMVCFQASQAGILLLHLYIFQPHDPRSWPEGGLSVFWEALEWKALKQYVALGIGGVLANSEWVYWEALSLIVGRLGAAALAMNTIAIQVLWMSYMIPLGISTALAIRVGATLPYNARRAKQLALFIFVAGTVVTILISVLIFTGRQFLLGLFTTEPAILAGCESIWFQVCLFNFFAGLFVLNMGMALALGMQRTLGMVTLFALWCVGIPTLYWVVLILPGGNLIQAWNYIWRPYLALNMALMVILLGKDWDAVAVSIQAREGLIVLSSIPTSSSSLSLSDPNDEEDLKLLVRHNHDEELIVESLCRDYHTFSSNHVTAMDSDSTCVHGNTKE